ncbi:MAG: protein translocase subunit SecD [Myxococcota bacterium]
MSLRARWIMIGSITLMMAYLALPSFFSQEERDKGHWWLRPDGLTLGLDLQGGVHWLLRIDSETAIAQELKRLKSSLEGWAEDGKVALASAELHGDSLVIEGDVAGLRKIVDENLEIVDVAEQDGALALTLSARWQAEVIDRGVQQALEVLRKRVDGLGVREPVIAPQGAGRILVQMPGIQDTAAARSVLESTTFLQFKAVLDSAPSKELLLAKLPNGVPEEQEIVISQGRDGGETEALLVPKAAILTGDMLEDARLDFDRRNRPIITFQWNNDGTAVFREFTGKHIGDRLAAIIDGKVVTAPVIQSKIGRNGQITGDFTREEAANTAVQLRSGALPIPLVIEEERTVGPSVGADSIRDGIRASLLGSALVFVFMAVYYSTTGLFANVALIVNILILIGLMSMARATLTLPGIAGVVLTVGMAVDSNVIIYERIREELRSGKNARTAIAAGFNRSFSTIFDSNLTTLLTAVILLTFGRGPVQGFGVTLAIGLTASMFTALVVTRALMDFFYGANPEKLRI